MLRDAMSVADYICRLCRVSHRLLVRRLAQETDRSFVQLRALQVIGREGIETQIALAERLLIDAPSVSRLVARLEREGLVERHEGEDRRSVRLAITDAGLEALTAMTTGLAWLEAETSRHLSDDERDTLERLLAKLHRGMTEGAAE